MLVSVIIPCFNVENYIEECVDSAVTQTYPNIEIICIDNNSTDSTWQILLKLQKQYPHIIIDKEIKPGACAARNKGLLLSKGEWLQFLDADDLLLPNKIEDQIKELLKTNEASCFIAGAYIKRSITNVDKIIVINEQNRLYAPFINSCGITSSNLWNKKEIFQVGAWNEKIKSSQETELMLRLVLNSKKYLINNMPLTIIRERVSGQISQGNPSEKWKQYIDVRLNFINHFKTKFPKEYSKNQGTLYDFLMVSIITLAKYNSTEAICLYKQFIKNKWKSNYLFGFNWFKFYLIKLLGLKLYIKINNFKF